MNTNTHKKEKEKVLHWMRMAYYNLDRINKDPEFIKYYNEPVNMTIILSMPIKLSFTAQMHVDTIYYYQKLIAKKAMDNVCGVPHSLMEIVVSYLH
jgi:hypothetical protein